MSLGNIGKKGKKLSLKKSDLQLSQMFYDQEIPLVYYMCKWHDLNIWFLEASRILVAFRSIICDISVAAVCTAARSSRGGGGWSTELPLK